jgi:phage baseplate assembly protein V
MRDDDLPAGLGELTYGQIASVDLATGRVTVTVGDIETQPIRWFTGGSSGTRTWSRPKAGEQVMIVAPSGDIAGAVALRGLDCTAFPPIGDPDRELVQFEDGAVLAYNPTSHKLEAILPAGATVSIIAPGGVTLDADVRITGDLLVDGKVAAAGDVKAGNVSLQQHKHLGVQPGGGISGTPQP